MDFKNLGLGLFSEASLKDAVGNYKVEHIHFEKINPNDEQHGYSLENIEELAANISNVGLEQPLVVEKMEDGTYSILTGRRRYYAIKSMIERGDDKYKLVPCIVKDLAAIDLPVSQETKRKYAIVSTNIEARKNTPQDVALMIKQMSEVYDELEAAGVKVEGGRRKFLADRLAISPAEVGRHQYLEKNADEETMEAFERGELTVKEAVAKTQERIGKKDVAPASKKSPSPVLSKENFRKRIKKIVKDASDAVFDAENLGLSEEIGKSVAELVELAKAVYESIS
ncbi:MAG: ParB N-terminal domain-containing protein [Clostridia bacterium]|nr:ParB N-terminal domain-containing protein [Clostridia bacterium]